MSEGKTRGRRWDRRHTAEDERPSAPADASNPAEDEDDDDGFWETADPADAKNAREEVQSQIPEAAVNTANDANAEDLPKYYASALQALHSQPLGGHQIFEPCSGWYADSWVSWSPGCWDASEDIAQYSQGYWSESYELQGTWDASSSRGNFEGTSSKGKGKDKGQRKKHATMGSKSTSDAKKPAAEKIEESTHALQSPVLVATLLDEEAMAAREEERASLEAIYSTEFEVCDSAEWLVRIGDGGAALRVFLPADYPKFEPPAPVIELTSPPGLAEQLLEQWSPGECCIYQWVEFVRAALEDAACLGIAPLLSEREQAGGCESDEALAQVLEAEDAADVALDADIAAAYTFTPNTTQYGQRRREFDGESGEPKNSVEILHGESFEDRKSIFQAHLARVASMGQVHWVHRQLLSDKKIACATHNIVAYRFRDEVRGVLVSDNDDDGETSAGGRLAELLRLREVEGVFVMVTRWYGGIQLGPDRFKDINRAAQLLLDSAGFSKHAKAKAKTKTK